MSERPYSGSIGWAIDQMSEGKKVARLGWNGSGMYLYLQPGSSFEPPEARNPHMTAADDGLIHYAPHIDMFTAQETHVPWLASQTDLLATDWSLVE